ncbi:uncharacterized protein LOC107366709 [Tetranychus urticae]|uniref:Ribosomal protein L1 n=2 Tax=Tetranychus urticae TaxID=32264 RepID=T1KRV7_TETUR|nr:uncharacterized protein LOC107366709 [Tetranychus urticae]
MMETYVERTKIDEVVRVFKNYAAKSVEKVKENSLNETNVKKKKINLLSVEEQEDKFLQLAGFSMDDKMHLQITLKVPPTNMTTYIHNFRPVPHPFHDLVDATICLIVIDKSHQPLKDRELDLRLTRDFYTQKLLTAGVDEDLVKHRLFILPMRELLTEYRLPQMKRRLATSYDVFLADTRLIKNRFKLLPSFLGQKFWVEKKKFPTGVVLKHKGSSLKHSFERALRTATLYMTGHGVDTSIQFGVFKQPEQHLADNLEFILRNVYKIYGNCVQILKIKSKASLAVPFYADLTKPISSLKKLIPRTPRLDSKPIDDEHPFVEGAKLIVYPSGKTKLKRKVNDENDAKTNGNADGKSKEKTIENNSKKVKAETV